MFNLPENYNVTFTANKGYVVYNTQFVFELVTTPSGGIEVKATNNIASGLIAPDFFYPSSADDEEMQISPNDLVTCYSSFSEMVENLPDLLKHVTLQLN